MLYKIDAAPNSRIFKIGCRGQPDVVLAGRLAAQLSYTTSIAQLLAQLGAKLAAPEVIEINEYLLGQARQLLLRFNTLSVHHPSNIFRKSRVISNKM